jgi:hypothetical protein
MAGEDIKQLAHHRADFTIAHRRAIHFRDRLHEGSGGGDEGFPRVAEFFHGKRAFFKGDAGLDQVFSKENTWEIRFDGARLLPEL